MLVKEAVSSDCSKIAGHMGISGDYLDLLVPVLLLPVGHVLHVLVVGTLVHGGHPVLHVGLVLLVGALLHVLVWVLVLLTVL
jgi:hypothetical protein